ncbi:MAG: hypothetical protein HWE26_12455, partial [Alteromonadaceae bacterium]|nr:hypothetical protein [Alteromonadaceae bacterium]
EHDLDPVAAYVASPIVSDWGLPALLAQDADPQAFVLQTLFKPVGIIAALSEKQIRGWEIAQHRPFFARRLDAVRCAFR